MADAIDDIEKRGRGRPRTDATPVMVRLSPAQIEALDNWRREEDDIPSRPEALRRLSAYAIKAKNAHMMVRLASKDPTSESAAKLLSIANDLLTWPNHEPS